MENVSVFIILMVNRKLRTGNHTFIFISLSFSDAVFGLALVFVAAESKFSLSNGRFCPLWLFLAVLPMSISLCQTLVICIDRFCTLQSQHKYRNLFNGKKKYVATLAVWLFNIGYFLIVFLTLGSDNKMKTCSDDFIFRNNLRLYKILQCIVILPVYISVLVLYFKILIQLRYKLSVINQGVPPETKTNSKTKPKHGISSSQYLVSSVKTVSIIVVALLVFIGPFIVEICVESLTEYKITSYVKFCTIINAFMNPFVYLWRISDFRVAVSCGRWK